MEEHHKFEGLLLLLLLCSYFSTFTSFGWTAVNFSHAPAAAFQTFSSTLLFVLQELVLLPSTLLALCVSWYSLRQSLTFFGAQGCFLLVPKKFRQRNVKKHWTIPKCIQISFLKGKKTGNLGQYQTFFLIFWLLLTFRRLPCRVNYRLPQWPTRLGRRIPTKRCIAEPPIQKCTRVSSKINGSWTFNVSL